MEILKNNKAIFEYDSDATNVLNFINGRDLTDKYNEPCCYSKTMRSHKKAWAALKAAWNNDMTMHRAIGILQLNGIKMHSYCAID
jgi:hypothetical protein